MTSSRKEFDFSTKVRFVPNHPCKLPHVDDPVNFHIKEGLCVGTRRCLKRIFLVDYKNPKAKFLFRSSAVIYNEMHRHLQYYYYMIHPFSKFRQSWETFMIAILVMQFFTIPFELSRSRTFPPIVYWKLALDFFSMIDVVLFFFTGYYDHTRQKVILKWTIVAQQYAKTHFFFDLMSSIPLSAIIYFANRAHLYELKLFMLLKVVRLPTLITYIRYLCERHNWNVHKKGLTFILSFFILVSASTALIFMIGRLKWSYQISQTGRRMTLKAIYTACFAVVREFMLVGLGKKVYSHDFADMIFEIICMFIGCIINMVLLAKLMSLQAHYTSSQTKYKDLTSQIIEYMKYRELPHRLRDRIIRYVNFKYRKHIFKEADIMKNVSSILRQDLMLNNCKTMIERVDFFRELPTSAMLRLLSRLKSDIYLTNDVIVQAGVHGNAMYFIYNGTVAVYTMTGKEICHLSEGSHFGEIALIINEPRVATVVAIKECELFKLSRKDFHEALEPYPELTAKIRESAMARLETTMKMMEEEKLDSLMLLPRGSMLGSRESSMDVSTEGSIMSKPSWR